MRIELRDNKNNSSRGLKTKPSILIVFLITLVFSIGIYLGWKGLPGYLKANYIVLTNSEFWNSLSEENDLETLDLNIKFKNYQKIEAKRNEALAIDRLITSENDFVKATLSTNQMSFPCEIRLKGDLSDHWAGEKWSFRVKMKNDNLLWGMSRFSLQKPGTRLNTSEWLFHKTLKKEHLLGLKYKFINLRINGKHKGIYALEEHFSKEMIEKNQRREGVIVSFDEYRMWNLLINQRQNLEWDDLYRTSGIETSNSKRVSKSEMLTAQKETAVDLLQKLQSESLSSQNIFSPDRTGKFLALAHLFNAEHGLMYDDMNFYFNPVTCLLEPIGFDANCETNEKSPYSYFTGGSTLNTWINHVLKSPAIAYKYIFYLNEFSQKEYVENLKLNYSKEELKIRRLLLAEIIGQNASEIWYNHKSLLDYAPWDSFSIRAKRIRNDLTEPKPVLPIGQIIEGDSLRVIVRNSLKQPVEIFGFESNSTFWHAKDCINGNESGAHSFYRPNNSIILPAFSFQDTGELEDLIFEIKNFSPKDKTTLTSNSEMLVKVRILGLQEKPQKLSVPFTDHSFPQKLLPFSGEQKLKETLSKNPFIQEQKNSLIFNEGTYHVKGDIYIPLGFNAILLPGCNLLFDENSTLISRGSIIAKGTKTTPISISASASKWGGILIDEAPTVSVFEHVVFNKMSGIGKGPNPRGIVRSGWTTTGGMTVHNCEIKLENCIFENCYSEDALNIISSKFQIERCLFRNLPSDGFDGDFVVGKISRSKFKNISGDGIDFSGSSVEVFDCSFSQIADKAVSVGESSKLEASYLKISDTGFGVVSKDLSKVETNHTTIERAGTAAISAYQKKRMFGPSQISCNSISITDSPVKFLIQSQSVGKVDGTQVESLSFDSTSLY